MQGIASVFLNLAFIAGPVELAKDVSEIQTRAFKMPLEVSADRLPKLMSIRLFVSQDNGKTWLHVSDYEPTANYVVFQASADGLYWFALQAVYKDNKKDPADLDHLQPNQKVYVNTKRRTPNVQRSYGEILRENAKLRRTVEQLTKQINKLTEDFRLK